MSEEQVKHATFDSVLGSGSEEKPVEQPQPEPVEQPAEVEEAPASEPQPADQPEPAAEPDNQPQQEEPKQENAPEEKPQVEQKMVPLEAMLSERDKWKQKYEALESQYQTAPQPQEQEYQPVDYYDDPQGYVQQVEQKLQSQMDQMKVSMSESVVKQMLPDYDEKLSVYSKYAQNNPGLINQVRTAENPALLAYNLGKQFEFQEKYGSDPESIQKKMRAEIEERVRKEYEQKMSSNIRAAAKQPTNVQGVRSASGAQTAEFRPVSFADLLGR